MFNTEIIQRFGKIIDEINIISITDTNGIIKYVSQEFCRISEYKEEDLIGKNHNLLRHPDMSKQIFFNMWKTIKSGKVWKGIVKNKKKNGGYYRVKTNIVPIKDENQNIIEYVSVRTDITKLVDSINELNNYKKAIDSSTFFIKLDENGLVKYANKNFIEVLGYSDSENIIGKSLFYDLHHSDIAFGTKSKLDYLYDDIIGYDNLEDIKNKYKDDKIHLTNKIRKGIIKTRTRYGTFIWCNTTIMPIFNLNKNLREYIVIQNDITDLEITKQKLKTSFQKLKELDSKKSEFLNITSHELRTPMTSIKGYISMMIDGDFGEVSDEIKNYLGKIMDSSNRLINLINDMLDISKLESSRIDFENDNFDLIEIIEEIIIDIKPLIFNKSLKLEFQKDKSEIIIETDKNKIKQIIINLLSNAIKFTQSGGKINIICSDLGGCFQIDIEDNGIGISKENQKLIFEKFGQVKSSLTKEISGTGLGLAIVKNLTERMGGKIFLESEEGKGSKFSVKLPKKIIY